MYDLLLKGGTVIDPAQGLHAQLDVALEGGKVAAVAASIPERQARRVEDVLGLLVVPGLIDLHVHVYVGVSHYGVEADSSCLARGVTTALDLGSAGAQTFPGLRRYVIDVARTRLYALVNISRMGMLVDEVGELEDWRFVDGPATAQVIRDHREVVLGIKVRLEQRMAGQNGMAALKLALELAEQEQVKVAIHIGNSERPLSEILPLLRPGDMVTHCFHGKAHGVLDAQGRVRPEVWEAVQRGIVFDVGHGRGSFSWQVAERALGQALPPGTISSDVHAHNIHGPVYDLVTTMSKFLHLGVPLPEVIARATSAAADFLGQTGRVGTLKPGAEADVAVLELEEGRFALTDSEGETREGRQRLVPRFVVRSGEWGVASEGLVETRGHGDAAGG